MGPTLCVFLAEGFVASMGKSLLVDALDSDLTKSSIAQKYWLLIQIHGTAWVSVTCLSSDQNYELTRSLASCS